jgi:NAD(P)-dependent dehydrogenase (short-subunit alcohol dehydrogenase family)
MKDGVAEKVVLVTGAASGIGLAISKHLRTEGAKVFGIGLDEIEGKNAFSNNDKDMVFKLTDIRCTESIDVAIDELLKCFGQINSVVNCAGIYKTGKRLEELSDPEWYETIAVNLNGIFKVCRRTLPLLRQAGGGVVVNIASVHANATIPGVPAYAASKAGVVGLTRQMALDYAVDKIRINALLVGAVATRMTLNELKKDGLFANDNTMFEKTRIGRIGDPDEIAKAVEFLISDKSSFITGSAIQIDGGMLSNLL